MDSRRLLPLFKNLPDRQLNKSVTKLKPLKCQTNLRALECVTHGLTKSIKSLKSFPSLYQNLHWRLNQTNSISTAFFPSSHEFNWGMLCAFQLMFVFHYKVTKFTWIERKILCCLLLSGPSDLPAKHSILMSNAELWLEHSAASVSSVVSPDGAHFTQCVIFILNEQFHH